MGGVLGWRRSCGRGQESEQEQTWEQERGLRATCDCGRDCDCDWDCHYGCDCACNRYRVRSTDGTRTLLVGSSGTRPSITVHGLACRGVQSSAEICARGPLGSRGSRSRGQDLEQERTREQAQGGGAVATCGCGCHCDCGRDCHHGCDCDRDRGSVRCTDVTGGLPRSAGLGTVHLRTRPCVLKGSEAGEAGVGCRPGGVRKSSGSGRSRWRDGQGGCGEDCNRDRDRHFHTRVSLRLRLRLRPRSCRALWLQRAILYAQKTAACRR